jgi:endonuclease YncB( thermonuclease family)
MHSLLLLAFALWSFTAWAEVLEGRVVSVADGETITLLDSNRQQHRIRLAGIDAPEKAQPFGQRSKQYLAEIAFGEDAKADCYKAVNARQPQTVHIEGSVRVQKNCTTQDIGNQAYTNCN